jgi:hypothetical protein
MSIKPELTKQVFWPDGDVWATAPDESWNLRGEHWPAVGEWVEACWCSRRKDPAVYQFARIRFVSERIDGPYHYSVWVNEYDCELMFAPDFWRVERIAE